MIATPLASTDATATAIRQACQYARTVDLDVLTSIVEEARAGQVSAPVVDPAEVAPVEVRAVRLLEAFSRFRLALECYE